MMFGLLVEYISVPKADIDRNKYKNPVGAQQFLEWREQAKEDQTFSVDYRRDKRALKLISQTEWEVRRRLANSPALTLTLTTAIFARAGRSSVLRGRGLAQGRRARQGPGPHAGRAPVVAARDERPLRRGAALEQLRPVSSHSNIAPHQSSSSPPAVLVVPEAHAQIFDRSGVLCVCRQAHVPARAGMVNALRFQPEHDRVLTAPPRTRRFPMMTAWVIICAHLEQTKRDLRLITDREMPDWVDAVIYGTVLIFWSFTAVQMIFEYLPPGFFFGLRAQTQTLPPNAAHAKPTRAGTELTYCTLSLTAKLYLGWYVLPQIYSHRNPPALSGSHRAPQVRVAQRGRGLARRRRRGGRAAGLGRRAIGRRAGLRLRARGAYAFAYAYAYAYAVRGVESASRLGQLERRY